MGKIKLLDEMIWEKIDECTEMLAHQYLKSIRAVFGATHNGTPVHIGTCILLDIKGEKKLLTAAHIIDENEFSTLYISGKDKLVEITGLCDITKKVEGTRQKDKFDFSTLLLSDSLVQELGELVYLTKDSFIKEVPTKTNGYYLALGYPNSKNKKINNQELKVTTNPFVYSSTLQQKNELMEKIGVSHDTHYLLGFSHKKSKDKKGKIVNSIYPKGISGGGLFVIEGINTPESFKPSAKCTAKLVGLLIEYKKNHKVILATKLSNIIEI